MSGRPAIRLELVESEAKRGAVLLVGSIDSYALINIQLISLQFLKRRQPRSNNSTIANWIPECRSRVSLGRTE